MSVCLLLCLAQEKMAVEEEAKRRTLLRYVHAVKAVANWDGEAPSDRGMLQLPDSNVSDEEAHAIAALLKGNQTITELNLRANKVSDEGARALAAVLSGRTALRVVDLRGNMVSRSGIRALAEALERNDKVRHVYVHAGGKVEALGTGGAEPIKPPTQAPAPMLTVETVCVVDVRENVPPGKTKADDLAGVKPSVASGSTAAAALPTASGARNGGDKPAPSQHKLSTSPARNSKAAELERRDRLRAEKEEQVKLAKREMGWEGRAGGLEVRKAESTGVGKDAQGLERSRSASGGRPITPGHAAEAKDPSHDRALTTTSPILPAAPGVGPAIPKKTS